MRFIFQIFLFLLTWLNLSPTAAYPKVALPSYEFSFPKADNQNQESEIKIGVSNFSRSGISASCRTQSENEFSQKAFLWERYVLENRLRETLRGVVSGAGDLLGSIVKNGKKIEYTNPAGKLLKWSEQSANDITNSINAAKNSTDVGRKLEGTVADFIKGEGKVVEGFGVKVNNSTNQAVTDLDILTQNEIIEVKNSYSSWSNKPDQVNRFVNSSLDDFVNPYSKKAILYIETPLTQAQKTTIINTIPNNVTLVNSLNELKIILQ